MERTVKEKKFSSGNHAYQIEKRNEMNKQELIEKLKGHGAWCTECHDINGEKDRYVKVAKVRELLEQLDEPQKVKVPACVAEYIEVHRKWGPGIFIGDWLADNDAVDKWLYDNSEKENNRRFLIAVKAFVDGYEVDEEPLYTVTINLDRKYHLVLDEGDADDEISTTLTTRHGVLGYRYFLTEKEIKSIDERYWAFAVPAEKGEE